MYKKVYPVRWIELFFPSPIRKLKQLSEIVNLGCDFTLAAILASQNEIYSVQELSYYKDSMQKLLAKSNGIKRVIKEVIGPYHVMPVLNQKKILKMVYIQNKILESLYEGVALLNSVTFIPVSENFLDMLKHFCIVSISACKILRSITVEIMEIAISSYIVDNIARTEALVTLVETRVEEMERLNTDILSYLFKHEAQNMSFVTCFIWTKVISALTRAAYLALDLAENVKEFLSNDF